MKTGIKQPHPLIVFVEGGIVQDVIALDRKIKDGCRKVKFCMVDYDLLSGGDLEDIKQAWQHFPTELKEYFSEYLPDEKKKYLDAIAAAEGKRS
jgi:hypothetical protein